MTTLKQCRLYRLLSLNKFLYLNITIYIPKRQWKQKLNSPDCSIETVHEKQLLVQHLPIISSSKSQLKL